MPVFNRLDATRQMLSRLRSQQCDEEIKILIVNDGSTDGTAEYLSRQSDLTIIPGDGTLWWGGAIAKALGVLFRRAPARDWVLFVNNDSDIADNFVQKLLDAARINAPAAVGSVLHHIVERERLLSIGTRIDAWAFLIEDVISEMKKPDDESLAASQMVEVDALSGRGVLYPLEALKRVKGMRPRFLPHYLADYELSVRVKGAGYRLVVAMDAITYSNEEFGNRYMAPSLRQKLFSIRSPAYLPASIAFWWRSSNKLQLLTAPMRLIIYALAPQLRQRKLHGKHLHKC